MQESIARTAVERGLGKALASSPSADTAASILRGIYADVPRIAERGERAAEQAAMAAETLTAALARGRGQDPMAAKPAFNDVFKQFESPSSYDPRRFVEAMKKVETATGR